MHTFNISKFLDKVCEDPNKTEENDAFLSHVTTVEALSESGLQLALGGTVSKQYGLTDPIQIISSILSTLSVLKACMGRYAFVQYNKDPGFSKVLLEALKSWMVIYLGFFLFFFWNNLDYSRPSRHRIVMVLIHPLTLYLIKSSRVKIFANADVRLYFNIVLLLSGLDHYLSFMIEALTDVS